MDGPARGIAPDVVDPFKRSARMYRSPTRGVGPTERGTGIPGPVVAGVVQAVPQTLTSSPSVSGAAAVELLAPSASLITTKKKIADLISVPSLKGAAKTPPVSQTRPLDIAAYKNEDLRSILGIISQKTTVLLSAFESKRHVTGETKGVITEMTALIASAIQLEQATVKVTPSKSTASQTEAQLKPASTPAVRKRSVPVKPPRRSFRLARTLHRSRPRRMNLLGPVSRPLLRRVTKRWSGLEWHLSVYAKSRRLSLLRRRMKPRTPTCSASSRQIRAWQNLAAMYKKSEGPNRVSCCSKWMGKLLQAYPYTEVRLKNPFEK